MNERAKETAVVLIAHGSRRDEANQDLRNLVSRLRQTGKAAIIEPAFLELAEPDIDFAVKLCLEQGARRVLLIPYFLSMGVHLTRDLSNALECLTKNHPEIDFRLGQSLGPSPLLDQLVCQRIEESEGP